MGKDKYTIRRAIIIPLCLSLCTLFALLVSAIAAPAWHGERILWAFLFILCSGLCADLLLRRCALTPAGLQVCTVLGSREMTWAEMTHLGCLSIGNKVYALLTTTKGVCVLSNNYEGFSRLLDRLRKGIGAERVDEEIHHAVEHPIGNTSPIRAAWITAVLLSVVLTIRLTQ